MLNVILGIVFIVSAAALITAIVKWRKGDDIKSNKEMALGAVILCVVSVSVFAATSNAGGVDEEAKNIIMETQNKYTEALEIYDQNNNSEDADTLNEKHRQMEELSTQIVDIASETDKSELQAMAETVGAEVFDVSRNLRYKAIILDHPDEEVVEDTRRMLQTRQDELEEDVQEAETAIKDMKEKYGME
ncbi:hypothetical protein [Salibacterium qingdaonense]|uniref:Uncharacterized protein n=1 Tax=Salibacterium qingdaonense TaxID=266892 RepID=A0A1I4Q710_9BACI|nr:hypothetical protein [Salibacterium qingdaonense]SFM35862.1 hypothetical protein SAMN04488054_13737 [Salibacterium qingdaonense]